MEMKILSKSEEKLLSRTKVEAEVKFDASTPSNKEISEAIAKSLKSDKKNVAMRKIDTKFGEKRATVSAYVYSSPSEKKETEPKLKVEEKEEAKAEESNEAPKAEEKSE